MISNKLYDIVNKIEDNTNIDSSINVQKALILESKKPSTKEDILYFNEGDLEDIPCGFSDIGVGCINSITPHFDRRSKLEYLPCQRHPIPYCIIKNKDKYFLSLREKGGGEIRLIGQKGLLGGHVDFTDTVFTEDKIDVIKTIHAGMLRELKEEAGLTENMIDKISFLGFIKIKEDGAVENDHLGLVYLIETTTDNLSTLEEGVLSGDWFTKEEIVSNIDSLERWSKLAFSFLFSL